MVIQRASAEFATVTSEAKDTKANYDDAKKDFNDAELAYNANNNNSITRLQLKHVRLELELTRIKSVEADAQKARVVKGDIVNEAIVAYTNFLTKKLITEESADTTTQVADADVKLVDFLQAKNMAGSLYRVSGCLCR